MVGLRRESRKISLESQIYKQSNLFKTRYNAKGGGWAWGGASVASGGWGDMDAGGYCIDSPGTN